MIKEFPQNILGFHNFQFHFLVYNLLHLDHHKKSCEELCMEYTDLRRSQGKTPFIDSPHWELGK